MNTYNNQVEHNAFKRWNDLELIYAEWNADCLGFYGARPGCERERGREYKARAAAAKPPYEEIKQQAQRLHDACSAAVSAADRANAQDRASREKMSAANKAYETARQTYDDVKTIGNALSNPREALEQQTGKLLQDFSGQAATTALRGAAPPQDDAYNAAHDRIKDVNDAIPKSKGITEIQDASLDELKRLNNKTLSEIDSIDRQIADYQRSLDAPKAGGGTVTGPSSLRIREGDGAPGSTMQNPWGSGPGTADSGVMRSSSSDAQRRSGGQRETVTSGQNLNAAGNNDNPWANPPVSAPAGQDPQRVAVADPSAGNTQTNPWASGTSSAVNQEMTYIDPTTGAHYTISKGYTLFRDVKTGKLSVVKITKSRLAAGGDQLNAGACSKTGVGIVTQDCELKRAGGS